MYNYYIVITKDDTMQLTMVTYAIVYFNDNNNIDTNTKLAL